MKPAVVAEAVAREWLAASEAWPVEGDAVDAVEMLVAQAV